MCRFQSGWQHSYPVFASQPTMANSRVKPCSWNNCKMTKANRNCVEMIKRSTFIQLVSSSQKIKEMKARQSGSIDNLQKRWMEDHFFHTHCSLTVSLWPLLVWAVKMCRGSETGTVHVVQWAGRMLFCTVDLSPELWVTLHTKTSGYVCYQHFRIP